MFFEQEQSPLSLSNLIKLHPSYRFSSVPAATITRPQPSASGQAPLTHLPGKAGEKGLDHPLDHPFDHPLDHPLSLRVKSASDPQFKAPIQSALDCLQSLKVLSWNVAKNNYDDDWIQDFLDIVEQHQPDKIFLQEVRLCAGSHEIPTLNQMGWSFAPNFMDTVDNVYCGVLIATRLPHLSSQALMTQHREPVTNTPKVSLFTEYAITDGGENLLAVNSHLINFVDLEKFRAQLAAIEAVLAEHLGAIIFAGDFNTWSRARWLMLRQMARRLGLSAVAFEPEDTKKIKNFLLSPPLDYIFYRGLRQKPLTAKVLDHISTSDHNPLLVELAWPSQDL